MKSDRAPEITGNHTDFLTQLKCLGIDLTHLEVEWSNQNHNMEGEIGHLKTHFSQKMLSKKVPKGCCYYVLVLKAVIFSRIACGKTGWTDIEKVTG